MYSLDPGGLAPEYFKHAASQLDRFVEEQGIAFDQPLPVAQIDALDNFIGELDATNPYSGDLFYARAHNHLAQPASAENFEYTLFGGLVLGQVGQLVGISYVLSPEDPDPVYGLTVELYAPKLEKLEIVEPVQILTPIKSARFDFMMPWSQLN